MYILAMKHNEDLSMVSVDEPVLFFVPIPDVKSNVSWAMYYYQLYRLDLREKGDTSLSNAVCMYYTKTTDNKLALAWKHPYSLNNALVKRLVDSVANERVRSGKVVSIPTKKE